MQFEGKNIYFLFTVCSSITLIPLNKNKYATLSQLNFEFFLGLHTRKDTQIELIQKEYKKGYIQNEISNYT